MMMMSVCCRRSCSSSTRKSLKITSSTGRNSRSQPSSSSSSSPLNNRWFTHSTPKNQASATAEGTTVRSPVISRRVWQEYRAKNPGPKKTKPPPAEEKPWPRNMQLAGYAAAAIFIPYSTLWFITSSPSLRQKVEGIIPLEGRIRRHFGEVEWDVNSYSDEMNRILESKELDDECYQYPVEIGRQEREIEGKTIERESETIQASIYLLNGNEQQAHHNVSIPASARANRKALQELIAKKEGTAASTSTIGSIAVDFDDASSSSSSSSTSDMMSNDSSNEMSMDGSTSMFSEEPLESFESNGTTQTTAKPLLQETHTFSKWHYQPSANGAGGDNGSSSSSSSSSNNGGDASARKMSNTEIEISRLEYTVQQLSDELNSSNTFRDIDDLRAELRQAKKDLSKLKWKRRLGLSSD